MILFFIEALSWLFSFLIEKVIVLKYLIIQRFFLFGGLAGLLWNPNLLLLVFLLKVGLPPFHLWFFVLSFFLRKISFLFISTIHKFLPLFFLIKLSLARNILNLIFLVMVFSGLIILETRTLFFSIINSSIIHSNWIIISRLVRIRIFLFYFVLYMTLICLFFNSLAHSKLLSLDFSQNSYRRGLFLILSGLPPFTFFWLEVNVVVFFLLKRFLIALFILVVAVLRLAIYYRVYHLSLITRERVFYKTRLIFIRLVVFGYF